MLDNKARNTDLECIIFIFRGNSGYANDL